MYNKVCIMYCNLFITLFIKDGVVVFSLLMVKNNQFNQIVSEKNP